MTALLLGLLLACPAPADEAPAAATDALVEEGASGEAARPQEGDATQVEAEAEDTGGSQSVFSLDGDGSEVARNGERMAARHLLVAYEGARKAGQGITRSRKEARAAAVALQARAAGGEDLGDLAQAHSDGPSRSLRGMLGSFEPGTMNPLFEEALAGLPEGGISDVVETPFGFHVIERIPIREIRLAQVLVQWKGSRQARVERTQAEARTRIEQAQQALAGGADVAQVARELSDGPSAAWGGNLGWMLKGQMVRTFDEPAFDLEVGEASEIIETPLGYHIIVRLE